MLRSLNRKLLVSVYNAQEAREAVLGGGRIIDSEDPKSALGNISPLRIMAIADAVLDYARDLDVQLSTNIGEDQLIFRRTATGRAVQKSPQEMAGKAAQAALGVALSMGTRVHPCSIVKVGLDGMPADQLLNVLSEVVRTLRRTPELKQSPVMSVLFAQDLDLWDERKLTPSVRAELVGLREFAPAFGRGKPTERFALTEYWDRLKTDEGKKLPDKGTDVENLQTLKKLGVLPEEAEDDTVVLNELFAPAFPGVPAARKTGIDVIRKMIDLTAEAGADAMMLDTSILSKVSNICLVDTSQEDMAHLSPFISKNGLQQHGILGLVELKFFVEYCHFKGIVPNVAGSVDSIQAQQLWARLPKLDQVSTRSAASAALVEPGRPAAEAAAVDNRQLRTIVRQLVAGLAPPEHGGELNLPSSLRSHEGAAPQLARLIADLRGYRESNALPSLRAFFTEIDGTRSEIELDGQGPPSSPDTQPIIN